MTEHDSTVLIALCIIALVAIVFGAIFRAIVRFIARGVIREELRSYVIGGVIQPRKNGKFVKRQ